MRRLPARFAAMVVLVLACGAAHAQTAALDSVRIGDPSVSYAVELQDGSTLVGTILAVTPDIVRIAMQSGTLDIPRRDVIQVRRMKGRRAVGGAWGPENPAGTRLLIGPTALPLAKGEATFSDVYLFFVSGQVGLTRQVSIGAGVSVFPLENFTDNLFYLTPKVTFLDAEPVKLAVGGLLGYVGGLDEGSGDDGASLGILYAVATRGNRDANLNVGVGWGYQGSEFADQPIVIVGGQVRVSRRLALISENWIASDNHDTEGVLSYGFRILGERLAADIAFFNGTVSNVYFPGIPFVGITVKR